MVQQPKWKKKSEEAYIVNNPPIKTSVCVWDLVELKRAEKEEISVTCGKTGTEKGRGKKKNDPDKNILPWRSILQNNSQYRERQRKLMELFQMKGT